MKLEVYQIDAFTGKNFDGSPACIVLLKNWLDDNKLLEIAKHNAVPETAFIKIEQNYFHIRWFTPEIEMDLCGHATLAAAHFIKNILNHSKNHIKFKSCSGELNVTLKNKKYSLDFPKRMPIKSDLPKIISKAINIQPIETHKSRDYILVYNSEADIRKIKIDKNYFDQINLDPGGVVVTSVGEIADFVSRYFTPQSTILEDPATGSSHCSLIPFWSKRLNKKELLSFQISKKGGEFECIDNANRVTIIGKAKTRFKVSVSI